ncbi:GDP-mannose 4,6-dehydratase [Peribacillus frigoritolerans]|uniref:GDP-mannose 4,6-dehydratase n=1 Tax=Peribacillus frigoritolerans TaxID=450367 RepID=UPI0021CE6A2D|nr:GDP-mannose 4,6-dehydratase [Peribacillus frigoritolerans]MCU6600459.1 GDP-mannose 4,6-dehydratase [Peribacillus frigoritolerans]
MNILVTGGAGFIGSHLCDTLIKQGHNVFNIDNFNDYYDVKIKRANVSHHINNPSYTLIETDIRDFDSLEQIFSDNRIDLVVHLAAMAGVRPSIENPLLYEDVNVRGTINLLDLCKKYKVTKFIFASSSSVYGNNKSAPFSETDVVDFAISPYAATKKSGEIVGHVYHHLYNIDMILLRFFTVYGPRQRPDLAIHKFTNLISQGMELPFYGDGQTSRDYTYIDDIISGIVNSIHYIEENNNVYEIINLGGSQTISLSEMLLTIENGLGIQAKINRMSYQPGDVERTHADITKAKRLIGYNPSIKFIDGIKEFISWYNQYIKKD